MGMPLGLPQMLLRSPMLPVTWALLGSQMLLSRRMLLGNR